MTHKDDAELVNAIETIATSPDIEPVQSADARLRNGGINSIRVLRRYLDDLRVAPSGYVMRSVSGRTPNMCDHAFWLIQDIIEPTPKSLWSRYEALTPVNVRAWLDNRAEFSLHQLQIAAATHSLNAAELDFEASGDSIPADAVVFYQARLDQLRDGKQ